MSPGRLWLLLASLVSLALPLAAQGGQETERLTGIISVKGNEPVTFLALTEADGTVWRLTGPKVQELRHYQNLRVSLVVVRNAASPGHLRPQTVEVVEYRVLPE